MSLNIFLLALLEATSKILSVFDIFKWIFSLVSICIFYSCLYLNIRYNITQHRQIYYYYYYI